MSDYQRFITYINLYENDDKRKNVGFAKIEKRKEQCRFEIHMKNIGYTGQTSQIYFYVRRQQELECIPVGNLQIINGIADRRIMLNGDNIAGSGQGLEEISGLVIFLNERIMLASQWKEGEIRRQMFRLPGQAVTEEKTEEEPSALSAQPKASSAPSAQPKAPSGPVQKQPAAPGALSTPMQNQAMTPIQNQAMIPAAALARSMAQNVRAVPLSEPPAQVKTEPPAAIKAEAQVKTEKSNAIKAEAQVKAVARPSVDTDTSNQARAVAPSPVEGVAPSPARGGTPSPVGGGTPSPAKGSTPSPAEAGTSNPARGGTPSPAEAGTPNPVRGGTPSPTEGSTPSPAEAGAPAVKSPEQPDSLHVAEAAVNPAMRPWSATWQMMLESYPVMTPFEGDDEICCIRIELKELRMLPRRYWYLGNNSFLLHGFFNYRYLILGQMQVQGVKRWFLGVPGVFQNQEKVMAAIFGFPEFKAEKTAKQKTNQFGYWYRFMDE